MWRLGLLGQPSNEKAPKNFGRAFLENKKTPVCLLVCFSLFHINHGWSKLISNFKHKQWCFSSRRTEMNLNIVKSEVYWILVGFWKQIFKHKIRLMSTQMRLPEDLSSSALFTFYKRFWKRQWFNDVYIHRNEFSVNRRETKKIHFLRLLSMESIV